MTRLWFGSLVGSVGASTFTGAVMHETYWLFGLSAAAMFVGFGVLVGADKR